MPIIKIALSVVPPSTAMRTLTRFAAAVLLFVASSAVHAQWTTDANPTLPGRAGIGVPSHTTARLRLAEDTAGVLSTGPFQLTFGSTTAMWWAFRLDASNNLHLDRQSSGWAEGFVFDRDGDLGIGTATPSQILHAVRDQNAGTLLQVSNASNGATAYAGLRITEGATLKAEVTSTSSGSTTPNEGPNAMRIVNYTSGPMVFGTSGMERMRIWGTGNVSIGGPYNQAKLAVFDYADGTIASVLHHDATIETTTLQNDYAALYTAQERIPASVTNTGSLVGGQFEAWKVKSTTGTSGNLSYATAGRFLVGNESTSAGSITDAVGVWVQVSSGLGTVTNGKAILITDTQAVNDYGIYQVAPDDSNFFAGNMVVGTLPAVQGVYALEVNGHANFNGTVTGTKIKAHYQDVAEWVPATSDLAPGTVVILNREKNNEVMASATSYDTTVAGVVSAAPGLSLGVEGAGKEQIATTGRVKVRVDARVKAVRVGDLLVTSDLPGTAMRSEPMEINGRQFHQPGTIIGKALEPLDGGVGEILVLLSMQ
jgi:hypothetical protein